jgi:hypothetical protein
MNHAGATLQVAHVILDKANQAVNNPHILHFAEEKRNVPEAFRECLRGRCDQFHGDPNDGTEAAMVV